MLPKRITVAAGAVGKWVPVDRRSYGTIGFTAHPHTSSGGTHSVQFTESPIQKGRKCAVSRSTTTLTITYTAHGLTTSDDVILYGSSDYDARYAVASVVDANNITVTVADSGTSKKAFVIPVIVDTLTNFSGVSGVNSGNLFASVTAIRLNATNVTTAGIDLAVNQVEG